LFINFKEKVYKNSTVSVLYKLRITYGGSSMNQRDLKNFRNWDEIWKREFDREFDYSYMDDQVEDLKNK